MRAEDVLYFWFTEAGPARWWQKSKKFDDLIKRRFLHVYEKAAAGELSHWRILAKGRLAEIIVLDQFSRNMFRDQAKAFTADVIALVLSQEAVLKGALEELSAEERPFLLMPYMHSESAVVHEEAVDLFALAAAGNLDYELKHKEIIDRFGRYPHRNAVLGRKSSTEELEFLKGPGSSF